MINKILIPIITFVFLFSCSDNVEGAINDEMDYEAVSVVVLSKTLISLEAGKNFEIIVNDFFYKPKEFIEGNDQIRLDFYEKELKKLLDYVLEKKVDSKVEWLFDSEIIEDIEYFWIVDENSCDHTIVIKYEDFNDINTAFCGCFKSNKIYSILALDSDGAIYWAR